jgi:hypothetical protein
MADGRQFRTKPLAFYQHLDALSVRSKGTNNRIGLRRKRVGDEEAHG